MLLSTLSSFLAVPDNAEVFAVAFDVVAFDRRQGDAGEDHNRILDFILAEIAARVW